jgi:hypothetical protein
LQILALYPQISSYWPDYLVNVMRLFSITNLNVGLLYPDCFGENSFWMKYYLQMSIPLIILMLTVFMAFLKTVLLNVKEFKIVLDELKKAAFQVYAFTGVALHAYLTFTALSPFVCQEKSNGMLVMRHDPSQLCYGPSWKKHEGMITFFLVFYVILMPLSYLIIFFVNRKSISSVNFQSHFGFLVRRFKKQFFWWEIFIMIRKTCFILAIQFLSVQNIGSAKYFASITFLFAVMLIELSFLPFERSFTSLISLLWTLLHIIVLISASLVFDDVNLSENSKRICEVVLLLAISAFILVSLLRFGISKHNRKKRREGTLGNSITTTETSRNYKDVKGVRASDSLLSIVPEQEEMTTSPHQQKMKSYALL